MNNKIIIPAILFGSASLMLGTAVFAEDNSNFRAGENNPAFRIATTIAGNNRDVNLTANTSKMTNLAYANRTRARAGGGMVLEERAATMVGSTDPVGMGLVLLVVVYTEQASPVGGYITVPGEEAMVRLPVVMALMVR